ncbi:MAG: hypothetical protein Q9191_002654 [Dirinaria sp. TL-2023a]
MAIWVLLLLAFTVVSVTTSIILLRRPTPFHNEPAVLRRVVPSPRDTLLPFLSSAEADTLPYPPNLLPGAREVETHYGSMRVNEWGAEDGKKVVLVHGDTTPGPMLGPIAEQLVEKGCRVMTIDLWGRGYSDTPLNVPHDSRLFCMQIFFALASSSISWTGASSNGFSLIGFSLGGAIGISFAAHYPYLINSIILLAPGGILRSLPTEYLNTLFRYPSWVPSAYLKYAVGELLGVNSRTKDTAPEVPKAKTQPLDIQSIVRWQLTYHQGFTRSFINTIIYGPAINQQSDWKKLCNIITGTTYSDSKLRHNKLLLILGAEDTIVPRADLEEDLTAMMGGSQYVEFRW